MNLRQPLWLISLGNLLGLACIGIGLTAVAQGWAAWQWLLLWPFFHLLNALMLSVGLHRYFSHAAFKTSKFWHKFMAWYSVVLLSGSPLGWASAHTTHHVYSDTDRDPHDTRWSYLLWKGYRKVPLVMKRMKHIVDDPDLAFVHRYGMALWIAFVVILLAINWKLFVFGYGMGLGSAHFVGALIQVTSHKDGRARDLPWMEFLFPAAGEWLHGTHHDHPGAKNLSSKWWQFDMGYWFIRLIEKR